MNSTNRRDFLKKAGAVIGFGFAASSFGAIFTACERDETMPVKPPEAFTIQLSQYPELSAVGGVVKVDPPPGKNGGEPLIVSRTGATSYIVLDSRCTHQQCSVSVPKTPGSPMDCPCHSVGYKPDTGEIAYNNIGVALTGLHKYDATYNQSNNTLALQI
ncbi:MAG: Rieske 2Fe-2S domain-containing protein [Chloroflexota bacterium]